MKYKSYLISENGWAGVLNIDPKDWTSEIGCRRFRKVKSYRYPMGLTKPRSGRHTMFIFDSEGWKTKRPPTISHPGYIYGTAIITTEDDNGNIQDLTDEEISLIESCIKDYKGRPMLDTILAEIQAYNKNRNVLNYHPAQLHREDDS